MCPVCIASAAAMAAGAGSTGGILAVCIVKFRNCFKRSGFGLFQKTKETLRWQPETKDTRRTRKGGSQ
jgi:hypothetical protein